MSQDNQPDHISKRVILYRIPGMETVKVQRDVRYLETDADALTMDIYYPHGRKSGARIPAVILVAGYPDPGFQKVVGCKFKEMASSTSWGQLIAASGLIAIIYRNSEPAADLDALLQYLQQNADQLGIDADRIGVWACSGNVPLALSILMQEDRPYLKCAILCYGFMLDIDGVTIVAEAAGKWGFVNPCTGKSVDDLPLDMPLFLIRAGKDQFPHLNETIDRFLAKALIYNLPITFVNHPLAPHAFELFDDNDTTHMIITQMLGFMQFHLRPIQADKLSSPDSSPSGL